MSCSTECIVCYLNVLISVWLPSLVDDSSNTMFPAMYLCCVAETRLYDVLMCT